MNHKSKWSMPQLYASIMYICGLLLFLEWLYPVEDITDTNSISIFIIYAVFCFFISVIQLKWWLSFLLKGFGLVFILHGLYFDLTFLTPAWFDRLFMEIIINVDVLFSQDWYYLTPLFRSFLFLLLIWLMSYLLHYWFVQMKRIFLFVILTIIYVAVLDTFTLYDATFAIIRTFIISLIALSMANFSRDLEKEAISFQWIKRAPIWLFPLVLTIIFSVTIGIVSPKPSPQWADPVPFIQSAAENVSGTGSTVQKVGYGEDDSRLGGSFIQDDALVFTAEAKEKHYWRIETRDIYTGKGWESSDSDFHQQNAENISYRTFHPEVETEELTARLTFAADQTIPKLIYPYGLKAVTDSSSPVDYYLDSLTGAIETHEAGERVELDSYALAYDHPSYSLTKLQDSTIDYLVMDEFTQLPESLPARVGELAEEITAPYETGYEKVRAIERYFSSNGFTYDTTGIAVPGEGEDYVDQFLFDTRIGYCDNFSTAMVVMLRTLDIPARWVKGFTSGELTEPGSEDDFDVYEVTNANAHSWVEVFFPETGWVPFEPTQGFSNLTDFHVETGGTGEEEEDDILDAPEPEPPETDDMLKEEEAEPAMADATDNALPMKGWHIAILAGILLIIAFILYRQRYRIRSKFYGVKLRRNQNEKAFQNAYHHLLNVLDHYEPRREVNETLREFSKRIDVRYSTKDMHTLTDYYERMLYRNEFNKDELERLTELWEKLIKKIMG